MTSRREQLEGNEVRSSEGLRGTKDYWRVAASRGLSPEKGRTSRRICIGKWPSVCSDSIGPWDIQSAGIFGVVTDLLQTERKQGF